MVFALAIACKQMPGQADAAQPAGGGGDKATLVIAASIAGQLVPCGCSPDQRGGFPRAVSLVNKLRAEVPGLVYVDAGDLLFESAAKRSGPIAAQDELKARTLSQGQPLLKAAARAVGPRDLPFGGQFCADNANGVALLDAGKGGVPGARDSLIVQAGNVPIGLLAAGQSPDARLKERAAALKSQGARAVVLLALPAGAGWQGALALGREARDSGVDLVVLGHLDDPATDPNHAEAGPPPVLAVEGHLQSLLRVDLQFPAGTPKGVYLSQGAAGKEEELKELDQRIVRTKEQQHNAPKEMHELYAKKIRDLEQRRTQVASSQEKAPEGVLVVTPTFLPLTQAAGEDPLAKKLVGDYDERVAQMNLELAKKQPEACPKPLPGEAAFTGVSTAAKVKGCASCHKSQAEFWANTRHAHAYDTLVEQKKQFSLDCVRCHVTGWQQPGGVCRIDRTAAGGPGFQGRGKGRQDVQCEMCHGPGTEHAADPPGHIDPDVYPGVCVRCHEAENSPHFDNARYRPFIIGPGHGDFLHKGERPHPRASGTGPNEALKASAKNQQ
ncbi:MAG: multiheme c-type cytochrome [Myxococcales bacterium]